MAFYVGCYQILADSLEPAHDHGPWALPGDQDQHMADTSNVEELFLDVTDMDVLPTQIQFGAASWTDDEGALSDDFTPMFYQTGDWYVRGFTGTDYFTPMFYQTGDFYVRGFTGVDFWTATFYPAGAFYVRNFTPTDVWTEFYVTDGFYVRSFTPTDFWTEFYVVC